MLQGLRQRMVFQTDTARSLVERVFQDHPDHRFAIRLWNGEEVSWGQPRDFTLVFEDPSTFRDCFGSPDPAELAEAYADGRVRVEGDLWCAVGLASYLRRVDLSWVDKVRYAPKLVLPASSHSVARDTQNVQAHYDLSEELFDLYLDARKVYSCAYFAEPGQSLERAQERKLDLVCKKLCLEPGEMLLDVGCGWGALLIWAAERYGVKALGITLSQNQAREAQRRVAARGLRGRVGIELCHYRDLPRDAFDKIASVGMYEHVGLAKLDEYLRAVRGALRSGGLFLNHGITEPPSGERPEGGSFIFRHVFPGAELASVGALTSRFEETGFEVLDVQSLRPHYALTLHEWYRRLKEHRAEAQRLVSERVLRTWDLFLAGCARAFEEGLVGVHQILAAKPDAEGRSRAPLTRAGMLPFDEQDAVAPSSAARGDGG